MGIHTDILVFRKFDMDLDGILNENEFINMIKDIPYCQSNLDDYIFRFLSTLDPLDNKIFTFNDCVSLFSLEMIHENNNENNNNKDVNKVNNELENGKKENINTDKNINNNKESNKEVISYNEISLMDKICLKNGN